MNKAQTLVIIGIALLIITSLFIVLQGDKPMETKTMNIIFGEVSPYGKEIINIHPNEIITKIEITAIKK